MSIAPLGPSPYTAIASTPATTNTQQVAQLNQLVDQYTGDLYRRTSPQVLSSLVQQITAQEQTVGEHLVLPNGPGAAAVSSAPAGVNVTV